eukprot:TRINITY_DN23157_c0_g1_i2.p2 TRINITY_DN23157_c0_g1~~TRINITY_DN23157_c0_g1_i2.p2  ORF type:complete len:427 (+),score=109.92 TRINITY_DN23157_c0_g1_i2:1469-2749(+)
MVCGSLLVDAQDRWCELHGNQLRVFKDRPDVVLEVPKDSIVEVGDRGWVLDGCRFDAKCISDKKYWVECLMRAKSDEAEELRDREAAVEKKEVELLWREHELTVAEGCGGYGVRRGASSTPSWGMSTEAASRETSVGATSPRNREALLQSQVQQLQAKVAELEKWIADVSESPRRASPLREGVLDCNPHDVQSGIEVLDSPSPVKNPPSQPVTPVRKKLTPRLTRTPRTAKSLGRVTLEVPGKIVTLTPDKNARTIALHVNDEHLGNLTWLGYDRERRWLTTGTGSTRSGVAVPDGVEGTNILKKLVALADSMGVDHNLPSTKLAIGDDVQTVKSLKFPSGKQLPSGTRATVVHLTKTGQVRVKTTAGNLFTASIACLEPIGQASTLPKDAKIASYIAENLTDEKQHELRSLDVELDSLMQLSSVM